LNSLITLFKAMKNDKFFDQIIKWHKCFGKRTEPHQDSAAYKAIVKWENAGKGIRQTGFVPSVYGLALVYGIINRALFKSIRWVFFFPYFSLFSMSTNSLWESLQVGICLEKEKNIHFLLPQTDKVYKHCKMLCLFCMFDCYRFTSIFISRTNWFQGIPTV